jgi:hypothetical protein
MWLKNARMPNMCEYLYSLIHITLYAQTRCNNVKIDKGLMLTLPVSFIIPFILEIFCNSFWHIPWVPSCPFVFCVLYVTVLWCTNPRHQVTHTTTFCVVGSSELNLLLVTLLTSRILRLAWFIFIFIFFNFGPLPQSAPFMLLLF